MIPAYADEPALLQRTLKNALSKILADADDDRDELLRCILGIVNAQCINYKATVKDAAVRLKVILNQRKDIINEPYDDETSALKNLGVILKGTSAADVALVGITDLVTELLRQNTAFEALLKTRDAAEGNKLKTEMKAQRAKVDLAYKAIVKRINSLIEVNGEANYKAFVLELNERIDRYNTLLSQREGRNEKKAEETKTKANGQGI